MSPTVQSIIALVIVVAVATWFVARAIAKRKNPGCGGDCGCEASALKTRLKR